VDEFRVGPGGLEKSRTARFWTCVLRFFCGCEYDPVFEEAFSEYPFSEHSFFRISDLREHLFSECPFFRGCFFNYPFFLRDLFFVSSFLDEQFCGAGFFRSLVQQGVSCAFSCDC
jgi:hypothetical protein